MLTINNICKKYKNEKGVFNISFDIEKPMITAVIGPNGSGKSTLFNIIAGLIKADCGEISFNSKLIREFEPDIISFMPENSWLIPNFTVRQMIMYFCIMKANISDTGYIDKLVKILGVEKFQYQKISSLSQGMIQKVSIVCTLIGNPKIMIFDEPLNYLDIESVISFKKILEFYAKEGTYILISSHILDFLDKIVQKTVFLKDGKIVKVSDLSSCDTLEEEYKSIFLGRN